MPERFGDIAGESGLPLVAEPGAHRVVVGRDDLGTVTVRQGAIVLTVSAFENAGLMQTDATTLAHQIALELNR